MLPVLVSNPIIMKLNPDMLPVLVAAVDVDGLTAAELTDYIEDNAAGLEALGYHGIDPCLLAFQGELRARHLFLI